jgi:hypothetical protein
MFGKVDVLSAVFAYKFSVYSSSGHNLILNTDVSLEL